MEMSPRSACPHDERARWLLIFREARGFRIKRPKNHPMRSYSDGWVSFVEWVGVASLRRSREHVFDARNVGSRLCLVFREIEIPLHCDFALTHRWCSDAVGISRHAREIIGSRPEDFHLRSE